MGRAGSRAGSVLGVRGWGAPKQGDLHPYDLQGWEPGKGERTRVLTLQERLRGRDGLGRRGVQGGHREAGQATRARMGGTVAGPAARGGSQPGGTQESPGGGFSKPPVPRLHSRPRIRKGQERPTEPTGCLQLIGDATRQPGLRAPELGV